MKILLDIWGVTALLVGSVVIGRWVGVSLAKLYLARQKRRASRYRKYKYLDRWSLNGVPLDPNAYRDTWTAPPPIAFRRKEDSNGT